MKGFSTKQKLIFFLIPTLLLAGLLGIVFIDDPLSIRSNEMLAQAGNWEGESNAYLYLLGLNAPLGKDPLEEGRLILQDIRTFEKKHQSEGNYELPKKATLQIPYEKFECLPSDNTCVDTLFSDETIRTGDENLVALKSRYLHFLKMDNFHDLTMPHPNSLMVQYSNLKVANRLVLIDAFRSIGTDPEKAENDLKNVMDGLRRYISKTENLVGKVIAYSLFGETLDVLFKLSRKHNLKGGTIEPLSKVERSFGKIMARELAGLRNLLAEVGKRKTSVLEEEIPKWMRPFLKDNMNLNNATNTFSNIIERSESAQENYLALRKKHGTLEPKKSWIRNPIGTTLSEIAQPNYNNYIELGFNLNAKIALYNGLRGKEVSPENIGEIQNPYYVSGHPAAFQKDVGVCFPNVGRDPACLKVD